ncbi:MAG: ABC transporter ATP-binding protein [Thermoanaerobaculia bacterium]|nr:ABC transporter ATP-binding protein [Thermoanaerobaculia bacterium]
MTDSQTSALRAENVTVRYGSRVAVDALSATVDRGTVYALLGRNGAGKSSLVRCLLGQQKPAAGTIELLGRDIWRNRKPLMDRIGIVPEEADAPPDMKVSEIAAFCARLYSRWDTAALDQRLRRFDIMQSARFGELSKGQKKQVMLALALAMSPELLVLDDPTLGLDVVARKSLFEEVIAEMADRGITVLITTHDLGGVEMIADRIAIMRDGRLVLDEEIDALKSRFRRIRYAAAPLLLANGNLTAASVRAWGSGTEAVVSNYDEIAFERFRSSAGTAEVSPMSLEEIFIAVAGEGEVRS